MYDSHLAYDILYGSDIASCIKQSILHVNECSCFVDFIKRIEEKR